MRHVTLEVAAGCVAIMALGWMWVRSIRTRARLEEEVVQLTTRVDNAYAEAERWGEQAAGSLVGLGSAVDAQFGHWDLDEAERAVGLLLLKGYSLREIAEARRATERAIQRQALAIFRKTGLRGRWELLRFFLAGLRLPAER